MTRAGLGSVSLIGCGGVPSVIGDLIPVLGGPHRGQNCLGRTSVRRAVALKALERFVTTFKESTTMVSALPGAKLFHKNIPGYVPPEPVYDPSTDEAGEEKRRKVRVSLLRSPPRLAE